MSRQKGPREFEEDGEIWGNEWNPLLGFDAWEWESYADVSSSSNEYNPHIFGAKQSFKSPNVTHDRRHSGKPNLYGDLSSSPHKGVTEADEAVPPFKKPAKANVPAKSSKRRNESEESNSKTLTTVTPPTNNELLAIIEKQQALDTQMIELQKQSISLTEQEAELRRRLSELEAHGQKAAAQLLELHQQREALSRKEAKIRRRMAESKAQAQMPGDSTARHVPDEQPQAYNRRCIGAKAPSRVPEERQPGTSSSCHVPRGSQSYGKSSVSIQQNSFKKRLAHRGQSTSLLKKPSSASQAKRARLGGTTSLQHSLSFQDLEKHIKHLRKFWDRPTNTATCPTCSLTFKAFSPSDVLRHLATHLADKSLYPFKCPLPNCRYTALRRESIRQHVPSHGVSWTPKMDHLCLDVENKARFMALFD
ncbi:hypothetical protein AAVH_06557 [Aphelenchoides avenae]|nr:hypothetical protein AAVH_06557 [Aphelenchus avenae]